MKRSALDQVIHLQQELRTANYQLIIISQERNCNIKLHKIEQRTRNRSSHGKRSIIAEKSGVVVVGWTDWSALQNGLLFRRGASPITLIHQFIIIHRSCCFIPSSRRINPTDEVDNSDPTDDASEFNTFINIPAHHQLLITGWH